jgi:hypothetical protein
MLNNVPTISTTEAIGQIKLAAAVQNMGHDSGFAGVPVLLLGDAGCGKTYAPKAAARELAAEQGREWQHREVPIMHYSPTDFGGARTISMDGSDWVKHYFPDWVAGLDVNRPAIIVLDECTKTVLAVRNAMLGAMQERRVGQFEFGREWVFVLTGNLATAKAGDTDNPSPMRSRVATFLVRNTCQQWLDNFAIPQNLHYSVTSFIRAHAGNPQFDQYPSGPLNTWSPTENPAAYACERSLTNLANVADSGLDVRLLAPAMVGKEVGDLYVQHCDMLAEIPDIDRIKSDPEGCPVPDDIMVCHYVGNLIAYWADRQSMSAIATYLRRMPGECAAVAMAEVVQRHPECKETQAYIQFRLEYKLSL